MGNKKHDTRYMATGYIGEQTTGKPYIYYRLISARKYALQLIHVDGCEKVEIRSLIDSYSETLTEANVADAIKLADALME